MSSVPTLSDIYGARRSITQITLRTPLIRAAVADESVPLWLKLETLQPTGSFKLRGAVNAVVRLTSEERRRGVVCCSTGNHGRAVAYACRCLDVSATVCLSELVPKAKIKAIEDLGARVVRVGRSQDEAQGQADRLVAEEGVVDIAPFDNFNVIAGQGTIGLELLEERPELETLLVPLSGGGLAGGIAIAAKTIKPGIRVIGISAERGAAMAKSLKRSKPIEVDEMPSLADSLGGGIGLNNRYTFALCRELVDDVVLVTEDEIYRAMQLLFYHDRLVAEGASVVGYAAMTAGKVSITQPTATIISGRNVDMGQFTDVIAGRPIRLGGVTTRGG
jgi:threonine dehydratase